ncbi:MAG: flagellar basal-body MS-ring/collar protein FliF [Methylotenera sp.]
MSSISRTVFIAMLILLLAIFLYLATWALSDNYQVLFSDLNAQDASSMIAELERSKTPYQLADNGTTILVDADSVYKTRLKLVGKGLNLNGSVGFELFNNAEFGMTEFAQKVNYLRALQGELERTITGFDEIKLARVHLVLPESGLFKRKGAVPKASVTVTVKDGAELTLNQVSGIQKLVSASVPEVTASEVTVVDQRGVALTKNFIGNNDEAFISQRLEVKKELESYMTQKLARVLDRVVGPGKAIVTVDISLNYDQVKVTKEEVMPLPNTEGQLIGAVAKKRTSYQIDQNQISNSLDDELISSINVEPSKATTSEIDYINNRRVEQVLSSPGAINKLSVGILVPNVTDTEKLAKIKEVVEMTAGVSANRGDGVVVHNIDMAEIQDKPDSTFEKVITEEIQPLPAKSKKMNNIFESDLIKNFLFLNWKTLLYICILCAILLYFVFRKKKETVAAINKEKRDKLLNEINVWASSQSATKL